MRAVAEVARYRFGTPRNQSVKVRKGNRMMRFNGRGVVRVLCGLLGLLAVFARQSVRAETGIKSPGTRPHPGATRLAHSRAAADALSVDPAYGPDDPESRPLPRYHKPKPVRPAEEDPGSLAMNVTGKPGTGHRADFRMCGRLEAVPDRNTESRAAVAPGSKSDQHRAARAAAVAAPRERGAAPTPPGFVPARYLLDRHVGRKLLSGGYGWLRQHGAISRDS